MAARSGALRRYELYGNPGTADGRIKGGTVSQRKFQDNPEQANLSGFKIRRDITRPERSELLAEFIGIMLGDGGMSKYQVHITFNREQDKEYADYVGNIVTKLFSVPSIIVSGGENDKGDDIVISSRNLVEYLQITGLREGDKIRNKARVPSWIACSDKYIVACLRGLIDTDGSFYSYRHKVNGNIYEHFALDFTNRCPGILNGVKEMFAGLGFKFVSSGHKVVLYKKKDIISYIRLVGTSNPRIYRSFQRFLKNT
ncbi:MAG: LAGLIDADG family homing endonuclease [Candidatus Omnitrophica bacterium]|nr:LAGLIDADG family homing endonuclease [Candidatus Omnitrophota bacterium]